MASSPIVARWELSRRLAALRKERGLDVKAITDHLGFTRNYWSAVENDRTLIAADKLDSLLDLLQVDDAERSELTQLREDGRKRGWWDEHSVLTDMAKRLCGLESGARKIQAYESQYVPGLLQTEAYVRAIVESDPTFSPVDHDQLIETRLRRQLILNTDQPPSLQALISEAVLRQEFAGADAQRYQLGHIADRLEEFPHIDVRIIPFDSNPGIIGNASTLLFFDFGREPHLPILGWHESLPSIGVVEKEDLVFRRLELAWDAGLRQSLDRDETIKLLRSEASSKR